jgi:hypothetical protein
VLSAEDMADPNDTGKTSSDSEKPERFLVYTGIGL